MKTIRCKSLNSLNYFIIIIKNKKIISGNFGEDLRFFNNWDKSFEKKNNKNKRRYLVLEIIYIDIIYSKNNNIFIIASLK